MNQDIPIVVSPLRIPQFRWLFGSNMAFFFAMGSQGIVRAWLAFKLTNSELALGMITMSVAIPMFFIAPIGGVISDRFDRRNLIIMGQSLVLVNELVITTLLFLDKLQFWHLMTAATIMGCAFPFIMPARAALVVNIVGKLNLGKAIGINMAGMNTTRILGPAAAGFLIAAIGVSSTYLVGISLYAVGIFCMFRVDSFPPSKEARKVSVFSSIIEGATYVYEHKLVLVLLLFGLVPMFLAMPFQNLLVVFAEKIWDVGSRGLGLLSALGGAGGVIGSLWVASIGGTKRRLGWMMTSMMVFGTFLMGFALSPYFLLALPLIFIANIFASIFGTFNNTAIQLVIPDHVRGRISSFLMMSFSLPMLGTLPVSAAAEKYGAPLAVGTAAILAMLIACLFFMFSPALRQMNQRIETAIKEEGGGMPANPMGMRGRF
ncbi:MAG: MFS transporter [Proteobacteria bacterium]|nr:MFS transporter [Pseudomonadota bacterium]MBU4470999.1 MFS transporter [Pseudomonadota bacterium]MCG2753599.1 MFS transporter [Desulfobacteraceae bacterium]